MAAGTETRSVVFLVLVSANVIFAAEKPPNIVFVLADDLGHNDVPWNNPNVYAPNLQRLHDQGTSIPHYYTYQVCSPSRASLMTGRYRHHMEFLNLNTLSAAGVSAKYKFMPQHFKDRGYATHLLGKWHLGFCNRAFLPTRRGFDSFLGFVSGSEDYYSHLTDSSLTDCDGNDVAVEHYDFFQNETIYRGADGIYGAEIFATRAQEIIRGHAKDEKPFLLILTPQNIHAPVSRPPRAFSTDQVDSPDGFRKIVLDMIFALDEMIGRITATLRAENLEEETIFVFTSDNGALPCEGGNNYPLAGGKFTMWDGGIRVPAVVHFPGQTQAKTYNGLFHVSDWLPTLLEASGGISEELTGIDGVSHFKALKEGGQDARDEIFKPLNRKAGILRKGPYKLLVGDQCCKFHCRPEETSSFKRDGCPYVKLYRKELATQMKGMSAEEIEEFEEKRHNRVRLYNVETDPGEKHQVYDEAIKNRLLKRYNQLMEEFLKYQDQQGSTEITDDEASCQHPLADKKELATDWCQSQ